jgi:glycosyltransferase involved in cell wall biosynthesis
LQAADIFILPSAYEGISNSVLEAMASGLAVIATDIPGNRALIEDGVTGVLVPCGNDEKLIGAFESLLADDAQAAYLGSNAREKVCRHYAVTTVAQQYGELYGRLVKDLAA